MGTHLPILAIAVPLLGAFALPIFAKVHKRLRDMWAAAVGAFTCAMVIALAVQVLSTGVVVYTLGATSPAQTVAPGGFPIRITLTVDGMSAFMGLISALVGLASLIYAFQFLEEDQGKPLAMTLFFLLWAGMLGMEYTGDMFNFFVFLEITSIAACALIGYRTWESRPAEAAFKTMALYTVGGYSCSWRWRSCTGSTGRSTSLTFPPRSGGASLTRSPWGCFWGGCS